MSSVTRTSADERFWLVANLALLGLVSAVVLGALTLG
jgi:hypothetical protein